MHLTFHAPQPSCGNAAATEGSALRSNQHISAHPAKPAAQRDTGVRSKSVEESRIGAWPSSINKSKSMVESMVCVIKGCWNRSVFRPQVGNYRCAAEEAAALIDSLANNHPSSTAISVWNSPLLTPFGSSTGTIWRRSDVK